MTYLSKYGFSARAVEPQGYGSNGVMLVGEAPGEQEDEAGIPFCPWAPAGSVLERAIRRIGANREQFVICNTVPFRPPHNFLDGAYYEADAVSYGMAMLKEAVEKFKPRAMVALGGVATRALTGLAGERMGVSQLSGFLLPSPSLGIPVVPCFHPSYLRRGAMSHLGVMMRCLKVALRAAKGELKVVEPSVPKGYILNPTESEAKDYLLGRKGTLAYDIETPYSTTEDSAEEAEGVQSILSCQFSWAPGEGIFLPWRGGFIDIARAALALPCEKLGWNIWKFDDPILAANGAPVSGLRHDLMWAWHHLQPDIPRGLQFAAAQQGWPWPWKHLSNSDPQFYGIVDVDVLQWMTS